MSWLALKRAYRGIVLVAAWAFLMRLGFWSYDHPTDREIGALYVFVASTAVVIGWARLWKEPTKPGPPMTLRDVLTLAAGLLLVVAASAIGWLLGWATG
jgi:hypothetical protein